MTVRPVVVSRPRVGAANGPSADNCQPPAVVDNLAELLAGGHVFRTIYADPPWSYRNTSSRGAASNHYATLSLEEICSLPVPQLVARNSHLHLWATVPLLEDALVVMREWGFQYKSCLAWVKNRLGLGNYWRVSHELLLLGMHGNQPFADHSIRSWVQFPRTMHSRKPEAIRLLVQRVSPGPYLELFGRVEVHEPGWTVFGDQVERRLF